MACETVIISSTNKKMATLCPKVTRPDLRGLPYKPQSNGDPYVQRKLHTNGKQKGQKSVMFPKNTN